MDLQGYLLWQNATQVVLKHREKDTKADHESLHLCQVDTPPHNLIQFFIYAIKIFTLQRAKDKFELNVQLIPCLLNRVKR